LQGGAGLLALSLVLPHPGGGDTAVLIAIAVAMAAAGILCFHFAQHLPLVATHAVLAATAAATGAVILASGVAAGQYGTIFVWATLIAAYYFPRRSPPRTSPGSSASTRSPWRWCRAPPATRH
jgi:hypothetical protein